MALSFNLPVRSMQRSPGIDIYSWIMMLLKLFTDMLAPLYAWQGGGRGEPERGMARLQWSVEHSISVFDAAFIVLYFTKWLSSLELRYQRPPTGQLEQEMIDDVSELIGQRVDGRTALAASLTEAFSSLLADESSSGGTRTQCMSSKP
ncbi:hypothetical protein ACJ73_05472 [Blastomyces percursus]|uniref:Uncharacterized protein n=1 Tax=Blastomyces percursus TaxID=1658174 RepID=A0A1J9Q3F0_9EURO|nr:hypothetical protein ACJ73_05472 [Blastomyces percursus]